MERIVLNVNPKSKAGKMLKDLLDLIADKPGVKVVEEKSPYNPEFVEKIKRAEKQIEEGDFIVLDTKDVWGSLGL
jgi:hypothetical protein